MVVYDECSRELAGVTVFAQKMPNCINAQLYTIYVYVGLEYSSQHVILFSAIQYRKYSL